jgi:hypothetical protein
LSSAILYVAIVAIWAGVLIPRWLRRDSSARVGDVSATGQETPADTAADMPEADEQPTPEPRPQLRSQPQASQASQASQARGETGRRENGRRREGSGDLRRDREHPRVLSSRRRLLGLLVLIAIGSGALAVTRTAAWWVLGPPSVMLLGYLALLREASKADAERRDLSRARAARVAVPDRAAPAPPPVRVPDAEIIDISASRGLAGEDLYDQFADAKLRAVGD